MVDDILDKQSDGQLGTTFVAALGEKNGTEVLNAVLDKNKSFTKETTRLEVLICSSPNLSLMLMS